MPATTLPHISAWMRGLENFGAQALEVIAADPWLAVFAVIAPLALLAAIAGPSVFHPGSSRERSRPPRAPRVGVPIDPASRDLSPEADAMPPGQVVRLVQPRVAGRVEVLHVDDSLPTLRLIAQAFATRANVRSVATEAEARLVLRSVQPDIVILEPGAGADGMEGLLADGFSHVSPVPVVLFCAHPPEPALAARASAVFLKSSTTLGELIAGTLAAAAGPPDRRMEQA